MMLASSDKDSTILVIIGSIFALVGTGIDVLFVKSELRKKKLKETGKKYISKISKLNVNENLKDNDGIHPCDVELEYIDSNGIIQKINIKQVYRKLNENSQINIYVDKENKDNYLIDWETSQL